MALLDIDKLVGKTPNMTMEDTTTELTIAEAIEAHNDKTKSSNQIQNSNGKGQV